MTVTIPLNDEEKIIAKMYAKAHSMSLSEAFKKALLEKIENECSDANADNAIQEPQNIDCNTKPIFDPKQN